MANIFISYARTDQACVRRLDEDLKLIFTNGGRTLIAVDAGTNPGIILWDVDSISWERRVCELAHRQLTQVEWHQYLPWKNQYDPICASL